MIDLATMATLSTFKADPVGESLSAAMVSTSARPSETSSGACVVFRRRFTLWSVPKAATLHLFADARYVLWVNGRCVERGPARFEPAAPEYDSVAVAPYLRAGENAISVLVTGRISNGKVRWRPIGLGARLVAGGRAMFGTDAAWRWSDRTRYRGLSADWADLYDVADARVEDGDWTQAGYDDSRWPSAALVARDPLPLRVRTRVDDRERDLTVAPVGGSWWGPLSARRTPLLRETTVEPSWSATLPAELRAGEEVKLRFPHLVLATTSFEVDADAGSEIELTYSPGTRYVCRAGVQSFATSDAHSVFEGALRVKSGRATFRRIEFRERLYPFTRVGSFHSSDPLLDRLWTTCVRGLEVTSEDAYVDCADRERVEWMDCDPPAFDVTRVAMMGPGEAYADPRLLESMLRRTALTLQPEGWVKAHTASDRFDIHARMEDRACDWVQGARRYVESCGRTGVVREIWPALVAQMEYFLARRTERGLVRAREWVVWGNPVGYQTCEGTALNAFVCKALVDAAFLGRRIGKREDADRFERAAKGLATAINATLWDEAAGTYFGGYYDSVAAKAAPGDRPLKLRVTGGLIEPTRHAALFALDQGVVPEDRRARTSAYLMAHPPHESDIMQYYYFWKRQYAADDARMDADVLATMRREWKDMADSPYEATFEGLHSWGSQAHCYGMFPAYFLSSYVLGVRREGRGLLVEPRLADLARASGTVVTELGPVAVEWRRTADGGTFRVDVPAGRTALLRLPGASASLAGHAFRRRGRWMEAKVGPGAHAGLWIEAPLDR